MFSPEIRKAAISLLEMVLRELQEAERTDSNPGSFLLLPDVPATLPLMPHSSPVKELREYGLLGAVLYVTDIEAKRVFSIPELEKMLRISPSSVSRKFFFRLRELGALQLASKADSRYHKYRVADREKLKALYWQYRTAFGIQER